MNAIVFMGVFNWHYWWLIIKKAVILAEFMITMLPKNANVRLNEIREMWSMAIRNTSKPHPPTHTCGHMWPKNSSSTSVVTENVKSDNIQATHAYYLYGPLCHNGGFLWGVACNSLTHTVCTWYWNFIHFLRKHRIMWISFVTKLHSYKSNYTLTPFTLICNASGWNYNYVTPTPALSPTIVAKHLLR